ncbi:HepT-like ribonuclease domain-containing protein [Daejeonella sp.]|uniref:HepT-like ribonuclease domain-containing protein n=1 Tax=Daejeonella sp. TaxID=2805397 RepID=UPI0030BD88A6
MTSVEQKKLLTDILQAIHSIDEHLEGRRIFDEYRSNKTKRRAVERELEIIGEAINRLLKLDSNINISHSRLIVDLRNKVIHAYDNVNDIVIWNVIMKYVPLLEVEVKTLLVQQ